MTEERKQIVVDVKGCARCWEDHSQLVFKALQNPPEEYQYFGTCPKTFQPILLTVVTTPFQEISGRSGSVITGVSAH